MNVSGELFGIPYPQNEKETRGCKAQGLSRFCFGFVILLGQFRVVLHAGSLTYITLPLRGCGARFLPGLHIVFTATDALGRDMYSFTVRDAGAAQIIEILSQGPY